MAGQSKTLTYGGNILVTRLKEFVKNLMLTPKIISIGIAYQMHGLVLIDRNGNTLRAIIWCDSRAVQIGGKHLKK